MKVVIIEDEHLIAENLKSIILKCRPSYDVVKVIPSVEAGLKYFEAKHEPFNLLFSDISLSDGNSFEIFEKVKIVAPIIFCTAYEKYAIEAFNTNGIDFVLKPFKKERIEKAILKYENLGFQFASQQEGIKNLSLTLKGSAKFLVDYRERVIPFESSKIAAFYIDAGIVYLLDFKNQFYTINKTLEQIELEAGEQFFRANRKFLINKSAVKDFSRTDTRKLLINFTISFPEEVTISKERSPMFLKWIETT